ncbi:MAG: phosphate butyryltransferase [Deltaproteobacteria bacterium]|nr:phosphate butyryltransferase [Deltaproteobacteria bacterium]
MIQTLEDVSRLAREKGPKKLAVLAPEDGEFMMAVKKGWEKGYIEPVLIGNLEKMKRVADEVEFDISRFETIIEEDRQTIADLGTSMFFDGKFDIEGKGQIPTSYIYRSIIREEAKLGTGRTVSVISLWEIPGLYHLVGFTDTGATITPDYNTKVKIVNNAIFLAHLLGYSRPKISVLSGQREIGGALASFNDGELLKTAAASGELGECEIIEATNFFDIFMKREKPFDSYKQIDISKLPHILLAPNLDTANILCKLNFLLDVKRRSLLISTKGPVIIPARSDFCDSITGEIAMGVVIADRIREGVS